MVVKTDSPDILKKIVEVKSEEVERLKVKVPLDSLLARIEWQAEPLTLRQIEGGRCKDHRRGEEGSPSRGML